MERSCVYVHLNEKAKWGFHFWLQHVTVFLVISYELAKETELQTGSSSHFYQLVVSDESGPMESLHKGQRVPEGQMQCRGTVGTRR